MKNRKLNPTQSGFTLMETVIAIGVVAVLITGFVAVFAPAVDGIRRSISTEEANRLTSTMERELVTLRVGQGPVDATTGFEKAFHWVRESDRSDTALLIYQYRGSVNSRRDDDSPQPYNTSGGVAGTDFVTVSMARRSQDPLLAEDLQAMEGRVFVVRCTQLVNGTDGALIRGTLGTIVDPKNTGDIAADAAAYPEAVLTFAADFFLLPSRNPEYLQSNAFSEFFEDRMRRPMFTRNLAVRR